MAEWNAEAYHKVSGPQTGWGQKVLARLTLRGDERAIDAGCGSGRLTAELLERLPEGRLVALDRSWNMLMTARANLRPVFGDRVSFAQVSLPAMPFSGWADLVFSTATFHWIKDHDALFENIFETLKPGGRLMAQCGGGANLVHARALAAQIMSVRRSPPTFKTGRGHGNTRQPPKPRCGSRKQGLRASIPAWRPRRPRWPPKPTIASSSRP